MYVGRHDVYPAMAACNFISLGEKMRELLDKNEKRKKKERKKKMKITDHIVRQKKTRILRVVSQCFLAKLNEN